ncbi:MAG: hypothetical protein AMJ43_01005 [Coxiella sp. DG_40]|nr:MAG: hypothetical protein AMJ43_01005 [Coxiella sp. DG_40]
MFNNNPLTLFGPGQFPLETMNNSTAMSADGPIMPDLYFQPPLDTCFHVTPALIKARIIGNPSKEDIKIITDAIMENMNIDPIINDYISIVFNHLPGFQIMMVPEKDIEKVRESQERETIAGYSPGARTMILRNDSLPEDSLRDIKHEFRHAIMHAVQMSRNQGNTLLTKCYFPLSASEESKAANYLEIGDKRVQELALLLKQEEKYRLPKTDKEYLKRLRESSQKLYEKHYGGIDQLSLYKYSSLKEAQKNWPMGQTYQVEEFGLIHTITVVGYRPSGNEICPQVKIVDCLAELVNKFFIRKRDITKYEPHHRLEEREADIYGDIPPPLIKEFYPELFSYGEELIRGTYFYKSIYSEPMVNYSSLSQILQAQYESIFLIPSENLNLSLINELLPTLKEYIKHGEKLNECQALLKTIINKGHRVAKVNAYLARINHLQKDYKTSCEHYKRAAKQGHRFNIDEMLLYASSLYETGDYKRSEKLCKQALRVNGDTLTTPKRELFEKILEAIRFRYHAHRSYTP